MSNSEQTTSSNAFWEVGDEKIKDAIHSLCAAGLPINVTKVSDQLTDTIVSMYDFKTSLFVYKSSWCSRIVRILAELNISYSKTKPNWENISMLINDKRLGIVHPIMQTFEASPSSNDEISTALKNPSSSNSSSAVSSVSKQTKLSFSDKDYIKKMFEGLDKNKMWKLSSGVVVEEKMKEFALACNFEHPVHSLILDFSDENWKKYFTNDDIAEILNYNEKNLPTLPPELDEFILEARKIPDVKVFKQYLKQEFDSTACEWAKETVLDFVKLYKYQKLPLNHQTEGDMLRRIWFFIDTVLDDSKINCIGGEKSSKSSSISRNLGRTLAAEEKMERKVAGRKVDLLFTRQRLEYGCCECGRFDDDTKQLYDGLFKMVKVLKDMLYSLYRAAPSSIRRLNLVGYLLYETKFAMVLCDSPAGYVTRITPLTTIDLPEEVDDITNQLLTILKAVYQARLIMEETNLLVRKEAIDIKKVGPVEDLLLLPCFSVEASKRKRRRSGEEETTED